MSRENPAVRSLLLVPPSIIFRSRPATTPSRLENLPTEGFRRIFYFTNFRSGINLVRCSTTVLEAISAQGYLDFNPNNLSYFDLYSLGTAIPLELQPPLMRSGPGIPGFTWVQKREPSIRCEYCDRIFLEYHLITGERDISCHIKQEFSKHEGLMPWNLASLVPEALWARIDNYRMIFRKSAFLTLKIPKLASLLATKKTKRADAAISTE